MATPIDDTSITLEWVAPSGPPVTGYIIEYRIATFDDDDPWTDQSEPATATTAEVRGLVDDTDYHFRIIAVNDDGPSPPSDIVTTRTAVKLTVEDDEDDP